MWLWLHVQFSGNCSTKRCRCSKSGQACTDFCQCNTEVSKNTDPLMEMRTEEDENIDESFWKLVSRVRTFNIFCSHTIILFPSDDKFSIFDVFSSDITLYIEIFQCNLYLTSHGSTNQSVILRTSSQIPTLAWVFSQQHEVTWIRGDRERPNF